MPAKGVWPGCDALRDEPALFCGSRLCQVVSRDAYFQMLTPVLELHSFSNFFLSTYTWSAPSVLAHVALGLEDSNTMLAVRRADS